MHIQTLIPASVIVLSIIACGTSSPAVMTPTSLFEGVASPLASPTLEAGAPPAGTTLPALTPSAIVSSGEPEFSVAVIVDTASERVSREQAGAVVEEASDYLREFSPIGLVMTDFAEDGGGGSTADMASRYMTAHAAALPAGLIIFSFGDNAEAKANGGYGFSLPAPAGFQNRFVSALAGANAMYVAVVDYGYKYMPCGYGGSDAVQSTVSLGGECRGQAGTACISTNGYSMCSNAVGNLYTSTPTHAVASAIVHGLLHNFGPNGSQDDYPTPQCKARMGYPEAYFDLQESEYYNGLCPFVYEEFTKAYRP